ncbi:hypothetical protein ACHQM5_015755 [Ranunculus cassubicifolius]
MASSWTPEQIKKFKDALKSDRELFKFDTDDYWDHVTKEVGDGKTLMDIRSRFKLHVKGRINNEGDVIPTPESGFESEFESDFESVSDDMSIDSGFTSVSSEDDEDKPEPTETMEDDQKPKPSEKDDQKPKPSESESGKGKKP